MGILAALAVVAGAPSQPDYRPRPDTEALACPRLPPQRRRRLQCRDCGRFDRAGPGGSILLAYLMYLSRQISAERVGIDVQDLSTYSLLKEILLRRVVRGGHHGAPLLPGRCSGALDWADRSIVDGAVRLVDQFGRNVGRGIAQAQTGQVQGYGMAVSVGVLAILGAYLLFK